MIGVGIREFRTELSRFLRAVREGETILVTDRGKVVAEVRAPGAGPLPADEEARYWRLVAEGTLVPPSRPGTDWWADFKGLGCPPGTSQALIDELREDRP
ncbi:MAG: type II toxin-antitoxin system prevent-host-death family antitoxin [Candidatus Sericytochromatia bacterium]|nr:type II toxin-antitoxin system prevent-host-death family antitoxin [Candidatus Tanganyikabacteria bacterium]